jgi:hypothetical protein
MLALLFGGLAIKSIDLDRESDRQVIVDREPGQYLGHVSTTLLDDKKTILAVYPKGHGRGAIIYKRSVDGGRTWSDRLPTPANWVTSLETPTIHLVPIPKTKKKRLILWSGLHPARLAHSDDMGQTWTNLKPVGEWGGIVVMGSVETLRDGRLLAVFHDDGRYFLPDGKVAAEMTLFKTFSSDGGLTWTYPEPIWSGSNVHLCEPGIVRSPDGKTLAMLLRENKRVRNSHVMMSVDEGRSWTWPRELPKALTGDRHMARYAPDGRLVVVFRDMAQDSPTRGDWIAWVGTWDDIANGREGQYRVRLKDNVDSWDSSYCGLECLPDGTFVSTAYGHWIKGEAPYILSVRFKLDELDRMN